MIASTYFFRSNLWLPIRVLMHAMSLGHHPHMIDAGKGTGRRKEWVWVKLSFFFFSVFGAARTQCCRIVVRGGGKGSSRAWIDGRWMGLRGPFHDGGPVAELELKLELFQS